MRKLKRFLAPIKESPWIFGRSFLIFASWEIGAIIHVLMLQELTNALETANHNFFTQLIMAYGIFLIVSFLFLFAIEKYSWPYLHNTAFVDIHKKYLKKFIRLDNNKTESVGTGKLVSMIQGGMETWSSLIGECVYQIPKLLILLIFTFFMIAKESIFYAGIFFVLYFLSHVVASFFNQKAIIYRKKRILVTENYTKDFVKIFMSKNEILQSDKIGREIQNLTEYSDKEIYYNKKMSIPMYFMFSVPELGMDLFLLCAFFFFGSSVLDGEMTLASFVGISAVIMLMRKAINESIMAYKNFTKDFPKVERMWQLFDETDEIHGYENGKNFKHRDGNIEVESLDFSYENSKKYIFKDFDLKIPGSKTTAFVGLSGSGKTTLMKILAGYISPNRGNIIIDGQKLSEVSLKSYYQNIGYLTQEPNVFDGSILENLTYSLKREVTKEEIEKVIQLAKCEFVYEFEAGLDTQIGERGIKLSGGQKQRLAIAKILLKDPKIIFLDEPTSALDSISEEKITEAFENLFVGRTVIIVAHRLQTVRNADMIYLFEDGKVVESGNHETLTIKNGKYKKLLDLQSGI